MANPEDLGRYRLKRLLGRGKLGQVWEAVDREQEGAKVAVKIMHAADEELTYARVQFAREARLAALLRHPNVVHVRDSGEAAGTSFMVMEMVEGTPLRKLIGDPATTMTDKLRWIRQMAEGIAAMHATNLTHRDVKPENVIVRPNGTVCLVDLGISKWMKFDLGGVRDPLEEIEEEEPPNTDYVPPETTAEHRYDEYGDQYAWGVIAYELLTGSLPNETSPALTAIDLKDDRAKEAAAAIDRARAANREDRWDRMELLLEHLRAAAPYGPASGSSRTSGGPGSALAARTPATMPAPADADDGAGEAAPEPPAPRKPSALALAAAAVALVVIVVLLVAALR